MLYTNKYYYEGKGAGKPPPHQFVIFWINSLIHPIRPRAGEGKILAMTRDEILHAFDRMRVWQRGDRRAVHKPLLVLFALARVGTGATASIDWNDAEPQLKALLEEFGPDGSGSSSHHPFWHLQTDGL